MQTINYAEKYSNVIDERFTLGSLTEKALNKNYNFDGVNKINVYSVDTAPLVDYNMNAASQRYGIPEELGNDVQEMTLTQDKAFTFTIDRRNLDDTMMANSAGLALRREIDEVVTPTVDKYRLSVMADKAGTKVYEVISSSSAYMSFLKASIILTENEVPTTERLAFITPEFYANIKLDFHFCNGSQKAAEMALNGCVGSIDGIPVIVIPSKYLPERANFLITHPSATIGPVKIAEYKTHDKPQGYSGWLCEGRVYYDAFVLNNKNKAIYYSCVADTSLASLTIGNKTLTPAFNSNVKSYECSTSDATNTVTATASDENAVVKMFLNSTEVNNGSAITWSSGENKLSVQVTRGEAISTYTVTVTKS